MFPSVALNSTVHERGYWGKQCETASSSRSTSISSATNFITTSMPAQTFTDANSPPAASCNLQANEQKITSLMPTYKTKK